MSDHVAAQRRTAGPSFRCRLNAQPRLEGQLVTKDAIRRVIDIIYGQVFNQGRADLYPDLVSGLYIQHNPLVADGIDGVMAFLKQAGRVPWR
jgi:hypothetical protein